MTVDGVNSFFKKALVKTQGEGRFFAWIIAETKAVTIYLDSR